jgi:hypothetical protein
MRATLEVAGATSRGSSKPTLTWGGPQATQMGLGVARGQPRALAHEVACRPPPPTPTPFLNIYIY